jgi:hypothetical protein
MKFSIITNLYMWFCNVKLALWQASRNEGVQEANCTSAAEEVVISSNGFIGASAAEAIRACKRRRIISFTPSCPYSREER